MLPFEPEALPPRGIDLAALVPVLGRANRSIASLGAHFNVIPNPNVLLSPLTTREAVFSSKIEGTQAGIEDVWKFEAGESSSEESRNLDIHEIINYRRALNESVALMKERPFCLNTLLAAHSRLMHSVRGHNKRRGSFRTTQNWIGPADSKIEQAVFVPPSPGNLTDHLHAWESYWHSPDEPDPLVQLAILHAQFEILHPFLDGNGRLGRLIIPLFLWEKEILRSPCFYLSAYLEENRDEYVNRLRDLGSPGSWNRWCQFFINGVAVQAEADNQKAIQILKLYENFKKRFLELTHSEHAVPLLDFMFTRPIFRSTEISKLSHMPSRPSVFALLSKINESGMIKVVHPGAGRRPRVYALTELLNICEGRQAF